MRCVSVGGMHVMMVQDHDTIQGDYDELLVVSPSLPYVWGQLRCWDRRSYHPKDAAVGSGPGNLCY